MVGVHFTRIYLYITAAGVKCCQAAVKRRPVLRPHCSYHIHMFWSFGIVENILVFKKKEFRSYVLGAMTA